MANRNRGKQQSRGGQPSSSLWMIVAVVAIIFSVGLFAKTLFFENQAPPRYETKVYQPLSTVDDPIESQVRVVASNFRCACGGCGELQLAECFCDMPKGAVEEKGFIREQLKKGFTVEQVIEMVDKKYGLRNS